MEMGNNNECQPNLVSEEQATSSHGLSIPTSELPICEAFQMSSENCYIKKTILFAVCIGAAVFITLHHHDLSQPSQSERNLQELSLGIDSNDAASPPLLWLLYFPNSGEEFTSETIQHASGLNTASNNGKYTFNPAINQWIEDAHASIPIYSNRPNGPFLTSSNLPIPTYPQHIVTKTSCGGYPSSSSNYAVDSYYYCHDCPIHQTHRKSHDFWLECSSTISYTGEKSTEKQYRAARYDHNLVQKAVHLVRDPFDVIIETFHSEFRYHAALNNFEFIRQFPYDAKGFHQWCSYIANRENNEIENRNFFIQEYGPDIGNELWEAAQSVPCYAEFFHYITWHNHASYTTHERRVPIYVLHYETFLRRLEPTIQALLLFCQLPFVNLPRRFFYQKYDYWSHDEIRDARVFMKKIVTSQAFTFLSVYLK